MRNRRGHIMWAKNPEACATMERLCRELHTSEVQEKMLEIYGASLTDAQVKSFRHDRGIKNGLPAGHFRPGYEPPNKGKHWADYMSPEAQERARKTQFRKGTIHGAALSKHREVGTVSKASSGYATVKVNDDPKRNGSCMHRWKLRARLNYEEAYGPIPEGCDVIHLGGDRLNDDPENLAAVPRRLMATINQRKLKFRDRETLECAMLAAELVQATHRAEKEVRA